MGRFRGGFRDQGVEMGVFSDADAVKSMSVMEGHSVTLNSGVTEVQKDDDIEWRFNSILIAKANIPPGKEERFRDRLKLDRTGSLTITNTRTTDSGLYKLTIIVGDKEIIKIFSVTVDGVFSDTDAVKSMSVMEGDSVTLNSGVTEVQKDDDIEWRFNSILIAKANIPQYGKEERFRDRLKLDRTGSLTITNTRTTDSGLYKLTVIVEYNEIINTFNVTVDANPSTSAPTITPQHPSLSESENQQTPSPPPVSVSLIVPISSAVAGSLMILAGFGIFWICKKHRKTDNEKF
ncbi:unnamed protein product [Leuciscus chuanchicus]